MAAISMNCGPTSEVTANGKNSKLNLPEKRVASTGAAAVGPCREVFIE